MEYIKELQKAVSEGRTVLGVKRTIKYLKKSKGKFVVVSDNCPEKESIERYGKLIGIDVFCFDGDSINLGATVKKSFPVSAVLVE